MRVTKTSRTRARYQRITKRNTHTYLCVRVGDVLAHLIYMKVCTMDVREGETFSRRPFFPNKTLSSLYKHIQGVVFFFFYYLLFGRISAVFPFCQRKGRKEVNFWGSTSLSRNAHGLTELVRVSLCMQLDLTTFTSCIPPRLFNCVRP